MNIGDLFLQLLADGSKLVASVNKEATKAGDAGAQTLNKRMAAGLRTGGIKAFGIAASGAFAVATKGALELENATAQFRAETGATAEEAQKMGLAINAIAGRQRAGLEAVTEAAIVVRRDLGATGAAAVKLTEDFVRFGRVTRQDAAAAVSAFDDILDSWGLTAKDATGLMDQLKVSQDKFGGSIEETERTLAALAPAMRAANLQIDDGIALLNLFGAKGLDANTAAAAFAKALTKVKSPAELQAAIVDIASTKDAFDRAEKAAKLFGARAGAKLANALAGANLDDYIVTVDEAAGATKEAADVLDSTFSGRVQKAISEASAALREFGAGFGPILTAAASLSLLLSSTGFGGLLSKGLAGAWKTVAGSTLVSGAIKIASDRAATVYLQGLIASDRAAALASAMGTNVAAAISKIPGGSAVVSAVTQAGTKLGTMLGVSMGAAATVALAAAAVIAVKFVADQQQAGIDKMGEDLKAKADEFAKIASDTDLAKSIEGTREQLDRLPGNAYDSKNKVIAVLNTLIAEQNRRGAEGTTAYAEGITEGKDEIDMALTSSIVDPTLKAAYAANSVARKAGEETPASFAAGVRSRREVIQDAWTQALDDMKNILGRGEVIARDIGILTSKKMQEGLHDGRASVRKEFAGVRDAGEQELALLISRGGKVGKKTMEEMEKGIHSKNKNVRDAWKRVKAIVDDEAHQIPPRAKDAGEKAGQAFLDGLKPKLDHALEVIAATLAKAFASLGSPIKTGSGGGGKPPTKQAHGGPVRAGVPYEVNENTRRSEWFVPQVGGQIVTHADAMRAIGGVGGSGTTIVNMPVSGALPVRTISDISGEMQRIDDSGLLPEDRIAPRYRRRETAGSGARL